MVSNIKKTTFRKGDRKQLGTPKRIKLLSKPGSPPPKRPSGKAVPSSSGGHIYRWTYADPRIPGVLVITVEDNSPRNALSAAYLLAEAFETSAFKTLSGSS